MERDQRFFAEVLSQMINNDVDAREVQFFIRITTKYVIKYSFSPYAMHILLASHNVCPVAIPEIFAQTQGSDY